MRKEKFYTLLVTLRHRDGRIQQSRYGMNRKEFEMFREKLLKPDGIEVLSIEDIKEPMKYYS
jgi:hypothetical protein